MSLRIDFMLDSRQKNSQFTDRISPFSTETTVRERECVNHRRSSCFNHGHNNHVIPLEYIRHHQNVWYGEEASKATCTTVCLFWEVEVCGSPHPVLLFCDVEPRRRWRLGQTRRTRGTKAKRRLRPRGDVILAVTGTQECTCRSSSSLYMVLRELHEPAQFNPIPIIFLHDGHVFWPHLWCCYSFATR